MKTYTTVQGDMWDLIAYKELGDTKHTGALLIANLALCDFYTFPAGIVLTLPDVERSTVPDTAPPWKR